MTNQKNLSNKASGKAPRAKNALTVARKALKTAERAEAQAKDAVVAAKKAVERAEKKAPSKPFRRTTGVGPGAGH